MKRTVASILCLTVVLTALFTLAACGSKGPYDGKYYIYVSGDSCDENSYFTISGSKWTLTGVNSSVSGKCEINEETGEITMKYTVGSNAEVDQAMAAYSVLPEKGTELDTYKGTIKDGKMVVSGSGMTFVCYLNGEITSGSAGGANSMEGTYTDENGNTSITLQGGEWSMKVSGIGTVSGTYEVDGNMIKLKMDVSGNETIYSGAIEDGKLIFNGVTFYK